MMKKAKFLLTVICLLSVSSGAFGQEMNVQGTVYDSTGTKPVFNAMAMAIRVRDSLLLGFTRTDKDGKFTLKGFGIDTFSLIIEHPSFDGKTYYIFGNGENKEITIPSVVLPSKSQELEEVTIYAYKDPIYYRGDTLVYVADSFKTHAGAVVEDLLKKLSGLEVDKDGKIKSQGKEINQVLVDGDEFFGSDPTIATKNLSADGVKEVKVYEKENEEGIGGDDEKIQVLDLQLKDDAKKGYFGRISGASDLTLTPIDGASGTSPFYEGEILLNRFDGAQKISVFALGSNTPRSSFGWGDQQKFGLKNERITGNYWSGTPERNTSGVPQTLTAGIYFSDKIGEKKNTKIGGNYSYYNNFLDATSASLSQYLLTDTSYVTDDSISNISASESHRFNFNLESRLDSLTTLYVKPSVSFDNETADNFSSSDFYDANSERTLGTEILNTTDSKRYRVDGYVLLNRKFMKKKRELDIKYDLRHNGDQTDGRLDSKSNFFLLSTADTTRQSKDNSNRSTTHSAIVEYVEPITTNMKLEIEYLYQYGISNQDKSTYDFDPVTNDYTTFNSGFSNIFENTRQQHRVGTALAYEVSKHIVRGGVSFRNIDIMNINEVTGVRVAQNINNILPNFSYTFKPAMSKRFGIGYRTSSQQPSINDLQPVPDNSNPNRIQEGNPDLTPNYVHTVNISFNNWALLSGRYVYAGVYGNLTQNAFSTATNYDLYGRTVSKTVNVDGNVMASAYSGAGLPLWKQKVVLRPALNATYNRFVSYVEGFENVTDNYSVVPKLDVNLNLLGDSLEIDVSSSYSFNNAISSLNNASQPYSITTYSADVTWRLPKGFGVGVDGTYTKNDQAGEGFYDTEFVVLNAEISKKFLKTQNLTMAVVGNDILNQNINARREINGNIITDYRTTIISRYFLLKATLRFNNRRTKEDDFKGHF